jgi:hypothetical protein
MKPPCSIDGCAKPSKNFGWCVAHYMRSRRYGSPTGGPPPKPTALERWESRVHRTFGGCWEWTGAKDRDGYGTMHHRNRPYRAHRFAYEQFVGPIPDGLVIDHLCTNRGCVNPEHLEPVTNAVNIKRGETGQWRRRSA